MAANKDKSLSTHTVHQDLKNHSGSIDSLTPPTLTPEEEARAWRKIDLRLVPILSLIYLVCSLGTGASSRLFPLASGSYLIERCRKHRLVHIHGFLDRGEADNPPGLAKLQGLTEELELTGSKYNTALVSFGFSPFLPMFI